MISLADELIAASSQGATCGSGPNPGGDAAMNENWFYRLVGVTRGKYFLPTAEEELRKDPRPPVLYLRSFADELNEYSFKRAMQMGSEEQRRDSPFVDLAMRELLSSP
jgi:hypothetical protein